MKTFWTRLLRLCYLKEYDLFWLATERFGWGEKEERSETFFVKQHVQKFSKLPLFYCRERYQNHCSYTWHNSYRVRLRRDRRGYFEAQKLITGAFTIFLDFGKSIKTKAYVTKYPDGYSDLEEFRHGIGT